MNADKTSTRNRNKLSSVFLLALSALIRANLRQTLLLFLLHPFRNKDIGLVRLFAIAVRRPHQLFAIGGKHWKRIEVGVVRDPFLVSTVSIDDIKIEIAGVFWVGLVGSENDALAVGVEERSEIGRAVVGNLRLVFAVGVHDPNLQVAGTNQAAREQVFIVGDFLLVLGVLGAVDNLLSVIRKERAAVVTQLMRELANVLPVGIHGVDIEIAIAHRRK